MSESTAPIEPSAVVKDFTKDLFESICEIDNETTKWEDLSPQDQAQGYGLAASMLKKGWSKP